MKTILTGALAALTLGGALAATAVPASAQSYYRGGYASGGYAYRPSNRGPGWGGAAAAGIIGLAAGAAIANAYDRPHYAYGYAPGYYAPGYYYGPRCRVEMRWNPRWGGYDRVRVCY